MERLDLLRDLAVAFLGGAVGILLAQRARLPPLLGYLVAGVAMGPSGLGLIGAAAEVRQLAEVGVMLLLFTIGLQFSLDDLARLRRTVLVGGSVQLFATIVLVALLARLAGASWPLAVLVGMLVSHSSSTLILRLASDRGELEALHTRAALGVSLFQDVSVVPMVLVVPLLAGGSGGVARIGGALALALGVVATTLVVARKVVPPLLRLVVATRQREAFLLVVIVLCVGAAWAAAATGLSLALGAFVAGLVVSESEYSHQALGEILPLRELFVSLFFVSIGMLLDLRAIAAAPGAMLLALAVVIVVKGVVAAGALTLVGHAPRIALLAGVALAQVGEFAFVLAAEADAAGLMDARWTQLLLVSTAGSMALMPLFLAMTPALARRIEGRSGRAAHGAHETTRSAAHAAGAPHDHVIVVGFGMNGRTVVDVLARHDIPSVVVEVNPETVREERARGRRILYGDASRREVLLAAGILRARALVIAITDAAATRLVVATARAVAPGVRVVVRTRYVAEVAALHAMGADEVVAEEFETAIEVFSRVLAQCGVPPSSVEASVEAVRRDSYHLLRQSAESGGGGPEAPGPQPG